MIEMDTKIRCSAIYTVITMYPFWADHGRISNMTLSLFSKGNGDL